MQLSEVAAILKWIGLLFSVLLVYSIIVPSPSPFLNPFIFAVLAGIAYIDSYVMGGVDLLKEVGRRWERHFLPTLLVLHSGVAASLIGLFYFTWQIELVAVAIALIGILAAINQTDRAMWHPVE